MTRTAKTKKLFLAPTTIRNLSARDLAAAAGGATGTCNNITRVVPVCIPPA